MPVNKNAPPDFFSHNSVALSSGHTRGIHCTALFFHSSIESIFLEITKSYRKTFNLFKASGIKVLLTMLGLFKHFMYPIIEQKCIF